MNVPFHWHARPLHIQREPDPVDWSRLQTYEDLTSARLSEEERAEARYGFRLASKGAQRDAVFRCLVTTHAAPEGMTRLASSILYRGWWYHYRAPLGDRAREAFRVPHVPPKTANE